MSDFPLKRGDTLILETSIKNDDGSAFDLTGCKVIFTMKRSITDVDFAALAQVSTTSSAPVGGGVVITSPPQNGQCVITVPSAATAGKLPDNEVVLIYDIEVIDTLGRVFTTEDGTVTVDADVTRAIT